MTKNDRNKTALLIGTTVVLIAIVVFKALKLSGTI